MDDDKTNSLENQPQANQPKTIFETVPEETKQSTSNENLKPEEIPPDIITPEETASNPPLDLTTEEPPLVYEENKNKYLIIAAGVVFFLIILFFIFKIFLGNTPKKEVKLVYWGLWEDKEVFDPLINQYQQKNKNVKIEYQKMTQKEYREKLIARSQRGQGPDIFRFHNTWLPEIKDVVAPLPQNIMSNNEFDKTFYPVHRKDLKMGNYYYGLPLTIDGLVLVYNDGLFKRAGIVSPPSNWEEDIIDDVIKLSVKDKEGKLITSGIALGLASNVEHFSDVFGLLLVQNGGDLRKLDQPEAAQALEAFRKFAEPPSNFWDDSMPNSIVAFIEEKVAMIIVPSWEIFVIKEAKPEIEIKVAPVPKAPGTKQVSLASYWVEGVSKYSKNQIEAWKFLRFLVEKENLTKLYEMQTKSRIFGEPYSRVDLASTLVQNQYVGPVIQQAEYFTSLPLASRTFDSGLNDEIINYLEIAVNSTIQGVSYSDALRNAKQGVDQVLTKYKVE